VDRKEQGPPFRAALLPNHRSGWGDISSVYGKKGSSAKPFPRTANRRRHPLSGTPSQATSPCDGTTARRCPCLRAGSGTTAARPHPRVVPPPRTAWAKWATYMSFVPQSKWPLPRSLRASEPVDPRERDGRMEKCQNKAGCSGFCCCQIRTYNERAGNPTRALMAAETSGTTTFDYQTPVQC